MTNPLEVWCGRCGALPGVPCITASGREVQPTNSHAARWALAIPAEYVEGPVPPVPK